MNALKIETAQDLYDFFLPIPEEKWTTDIRQDGEGRSCALGHLDLALGIDEWESNVEDDPSVELVDKIFSPGRDVWNEPLPLVVANNSYPENPKQGVLDYIKKFLPHEEQTKS